MPVWDPDRYLAFADDRSRPFVDLIARVEGRPGTIVDLGCGPGHLTEVLRARWPDARVHGVDASPEMVERARAGNTDPRADYELADASTWAPSDPIDLIVSNAMFQWIPGHLGVIERLCAHVAPGGSFALQVPHNLDGHSHRLLRELAAREPYAQHVDDRQLLRSTDGPEPYLELFAGLGWHADVWETTYLHVLAGDDPVFDWISGTGARPVLQALPDDLRARFEEEYRARLREAYPRRPFGTVLPFRRVFAVAHRR